MIITFLNFIHLFKNYVKTFFLNQKIYTFQLKSSKMCVKMERDNIPLGHYFRMCYNRYMDIKIE